jgi:threonine dehydrogenase-like Zn-dependent dehydrogenase
VSFRCAVEAIATGEAGCGLVSHVIGIESVAAAFDLARSRHDGALKVALGWTMG